MIRRRRDYDNNRNSSGIGIDMGIIFKLLLLPTLLKTTVASVVEAISKLGTSVPSRKKTVIVKDSQGNDITSIEEMDDIEYLTLIQNHFKTDTIVMRIIENVIDNILLG